MSIKKLPHWVLVDKFPAFYDSESVSVVQQTARIYGKMNELVESYNKFIDLINEEIGNYQDGVTKDIETFKNNITKIITDYMYKIDTRIAHQDRAIAEVYDKFKNQMREKVDELFQEMQDAGELETIIENSVSEFIENLKSTLTAEVTSAVNTEMNESVTAAKNDVNQAISQAKDDLSDEVVRGKQSINNAVEDGKRELSQNSINVITALNNEIYAKNLPFGLSCTDQAGYDAMNQYDGVYKLYCDFIGDMGVVESHYVGDIEPGSTIIKTGNYAGYHIIIYRNNDACDGYIITRFMLSETETVDNVKRVKFNADNAVINGEDLDGNGVIDTFDVSVGADTAGTVVNLITLNNGAIGYEGTTVKEGTSFIATIDACDNPVTVVMYNDSTETNYTTFGAKYNAGDEIRIEKVTGKIVIY